MDRRIRTTMEARSELKRTLAIGGILKKPVEIKRITNKKIERYVPTIKKAKKELNLKINYKLRPALYSIIKHQYEKKD